MTDDYDQFLRSLDIPVERATLVPASQFDMVQAAAQRRAQARMDHLPPPDMLARQIAAHGDARRAYAYLDELAAEVGRALRETGAR